MPRKQLLTLLLGVAMVVAAIVLIMVLAPMSSWAGA